MHARLARWIGAVLAAGVIAVVASAVSSGSSAGVATRAPSLTPVRRAAGTVGSPAKASGAAPSTTVVSPPATGTSASPSPSARADRPADVATAQPISYVTTAAPEPAPASADAAPAHDIALYGDSLTVMAWDRYQWITADDVQTDGHMWDGTELGDWRDSILANPHDRLVLALGTNDAMRDGAAPWADLLNKLPASKCIVWPKPYEGGSKVKLFNTQMAAIVAAHPNVHVIDWDSQVKAHPEWVQYDHTHYLPDGSNAYAEMLREAALTCP